MLTTCEKELLINAAHEAIEAYLRFLDPPKLEEQDKTQALLEDRGAFVSLHSGPNLRGCIGVFASKKSLFETVVEMSVAAAIKDPRFTPVKLNELDSIEVEISVMGPLKEIKDINLIEIGRHGLYVMRGMEDRGVLLPQVALEYKLDRIGFLEQTCLKAGLEPDAWKEKGTRIFFFEAEVFSEKMLETA